MTDSYSRSFAGVTRAAAEEKDEGSLSLARDVSRPVTRSSTPTTAPFDASSDSIDCRLGLGLGGLGGGAHNRSTRAWNASRDSAADAAPRTAGVRPSDVANVVVSGEGSGRRVGRVGWVGRVGARSGKERSKVAARAAATAPRRQKAHSPRIRRLRALAPSVLCLHLLAYGSARRSASAYVLAAARVASAAHHSRLCRPSRNHAAHPSRRSHLLCDSVASARFFARLARLGRDAATPRHTPSSSRFESVTSPWRSPPFSRDDAPPR